MKSQRRAPSPKVTPTVAAKIKFLWNTTNMNQAQIAARLGALNQGRVCEVVNGRKFVDVPAAEGL
ncbi:hypothetical protein [Lentilitoribacter sp. EG35]|uniref:hypothetical protein n=1 Tax=Lentilitoribacter sp. EG35 TaxID=3234192 RepID=UPI003460C82B